MVALWIIILLAVLQGLLEWLPVSSEGWTILVLNWLNETENALAVALFLHLGTMVAVIIRFRKDFGLLFDYRLWKKEGEGKEPTEKKLEVKNQSEEEKKVEKENENTTIFDEREQRKAEQKKLWLFLLIATAATAVVGVPIYLLLKLVLEDSNLAFAGGKVTSGDIITMVIGLLLIGTGLFILYSRKKAARKSLFEMKYWEMAVAGAVQGLAILPGVSRSGSTVGTLLVEGIEEEEALRGSFLLSVPAILGANVLTIIIDLIQGEFSFEGIPWYGMILAFIVSGVVGYLTIDLFLYIARKVNFGWFCITVGALALVITLILVILALTTG